MLCVSYIYIDPAVAFADLGYHILLEKPMAVTKEDCLRIYEAVKRNNVLMSVCHVMRCSPLSLKVRDLIQKGHIGTVVNIQHMEPVGFWHHVMYIFIYQYLYIHIHRVF
jgi:predicted dehydrogenase